MTFVVFLQVRFVFKVPKSDCSGIVAKNPQVFRLGVVPPDCWINLLAKWNKTIIAGKLLVSSSKE